MVTFAAFRPERRTRITYRGTTHMGKGDRKTAKGKRFNSSYGNARPKSPAARKAVIVRPEQSTPP